MNIDTVYSILMNSGWFFLIAWTLLLVSASIVVFWDVPSKKSLRLVHSRAKVQHLPLYGAIREVDALSRIAVRR